MPIVVLFASLAVLALSAAGATALWNLQTRDIREAKTNLMTLDLLLAGETERAIQNVDLVLESTQRKIASEGISAAEDYARVQADSSTHEFLRTEIAGLPQIKILSLVAADGHLINFSDAYPVP
ncbi:MAG TPA: hybrid sensor histidine kinase/response regulator, partial [Beijerinckia sp.]|nr:hybrid sensor histidine kinase/response regulator [Beijerinckia sp.]